MVTKTLVISFVYLFEIDFKCNFGYIFFGVKKCEICHWGYPQEITQNHQSLWHFAFSRDQRPNGVTQVTDV